ncbi:MAG: hypothetical protein HYS12_30070, partial [Planctomycetes bacterium]|nr:hypothetical protein [Planctomycetota bacterium]
MPVWAVCALAAFGALGWLGFCFLLGKLSPETALAGVSAAGVELSKALFICFTAGVGISWLLKQITEDTPATALENAGISTIYAAREEATEDILRLVRNRNVRRLDIIGISLRDFLHLGGRLRQVWRAICRRLEDEQRSGVPRQERFRVRMLILHPKSAEGRFRHYVEQQQMGETGIPFDIPQSVGELRRVQQDLTQGAQPTLQFRLYEHCPFAFILLSETEAYVEQYGYPDLRKRRSMSLIKYLSDAPQYGELEYTFDVIWDHAPESEPADSDVGTAAAIQEARITNIFRREQRSDLSIAQYKRLKEAKSGDTISILAITGRFYFSFPREGVLRDITKEGEEGARVRFALVNPISQQAILRAVADNSPPEEIKRTLVGWNWERHRNSRLFQDAQESIQKGDALMAQGYRFEMRLYSGAIACALLLTRTANFIEQYVYGRSKEFQQGRVLGGEYPVIQYEVEDGAEPRIEHEVLAATFDVLWDSYSISVEEYKRRLEEAEFQKNLER